MDATPIGANVRSTVATYSGVMDELRRVYARIPDAREAGLKAGDFSYNTGSLRCGHCDGTGQIVLDVQFLPDVDIVCPQCAGSRYGEAAREIRRRPRRRRGEGKGEADGTTHPAGRAEPAGPADLSQRGIHSMT